MYKLIKPMLLLLIVALCNTRAIAQTNNIQPFAIGEIRTLHSKILNEDRTLNIYLPQTFDRKKTYPVIYLLDGSANEDFLHIVGLVQFFNMLNMPDAIVVGIANVDRKRDFTFHTSVKELQTAYPTTGKSEKFISFIETELQPFISKNYPTNHTKYIIGQSLGGLLATEILLKKPNLFSHYLIVSPSLWWDNESLLAQAPTQLAQPFTNDTYVYIAVGGKEDPVMQKDAAALADLLKNSGQPKLKTDFVPLAQEDHATILHQSINEAFKLLFPTKN